LRGRAAGLSVVVPHGAAADPNTKVLIAAGTKEPIENFTVGEKVKATDPVTGKTSAKAVTALRKNRDTDLTGMTVLVGTAASLQRPRTPHGRSCTRRTTTASRTRPTVPGSLSAS
jgi:hypothetical protein